MSKTTLSRSDEWATEQKLFDDLCEKYNIHPELDVAATFYNRKCKYYIPDDHYGGALNYECPTDGLVDGKVVDIWCNPPHSKTKDFTLMLHGLWLDIKRNIMMLVPAGVLCRKYFAEIFEKFMLTRHGVEWHPVRPRPKFINPLQKKQEGAARQDYIVIIWRASAK